MIAFKVRLNGKRLTTAGAGDLSVLTAMVTAVGKLGSLTKKSKATPEELFLDVGGLTSRGKKAKNEHLNWVQQLTLKPGDKIGIEILNAEKTETPAYRTSAGDREEDERALFEYAKTNYFRLREKYENI